MIIKINAQERHLAQHGWLSSFHLFSFAEYYDPSNMSFGVLRVFNDDTIDAESGFGTHGHQNMEIVTILLMGELTHQDTMGNSKVIHKGEVQYMSAGTGVKHSEVNTSQDRTHLYQIWLTPKQNNLTPTYDQKDFSHIEKNILVPVATGEDLEGAIRIQADATIYKATLDASTSILYKPKAGRGVFVYITEGMVEINGTIFTTGDQARIEKEESITITTKSNQTATFILLNVAI